MRNCLFLREKVLYSSCGIYSTIHALYYVIGNWLNFLQEKSDSQDYLILRLPLYALRGRGPLSLENREPEEEGKASTALALVTTTCTKVASPPLSVIIWTVCCPPLSFISAGKVYGQPCSAMAVCLLLLAHSPSVPCHRLLAGFR